MSLTQGRNTEELANGAKSLLLPMGKTIIFGGSLVALDATGHAIPARKATDLIVVGRAEESMDNSNGEAGNITIRVKRGVFKWDNDSVTANKITQAHVMKDCYVVDECTVTSLATGSSKAGKVIAVQNDGIYVETL